MRYIDASIISIPGRIYEWPAAVDGGQKDLGQTDAGLPALYELDERLLVVESRSHI